MSIYGQSIITKDSMVLAYESATPCSYESLLESMIDSQYFFESIIDHVEFQQYIVNEAGENGKGKFDIKAAFDTIIEKIKKMFTTFIGWIKTAVEEFKRKIKEWYEKHNIQRGLLKVALHGFSYKDIEAAQEKIDNYEKYAKDNNKDLGFIKGLKDTEFPQGINDAWISFSGAGFSQKYGIEKIFEKELDDINNRISKIGTMSVGDAKDEYEKVSKNISELKEKISKNATNKDTRSLGSEKEKRDKLAKSYRGYDSDKFFDDFYDDLDKVTDQYSIDQYWSLKKGQLISEDGFNRTVKFIEDSVKRANETKSQYNYIKYAKESIESAKDNIEKCKKSLKSNDIRFTTKTTYDYNINTVDNVENNVKIGGSYAELYAAKLSLQQAQLTLQIATSGLKNALYINKKVTGMAFSLILGYRAMCYGINHGYINPDVDTEDNFISIKKKDREENLKKFNYSRNN